MTSLESFLKAASIIPHVACLLSVLGSAAIIVDVARRYRSSDARKPSTYHRLMLGMSGCSVVANLFGTGLSTWPMPEGTGWGAVGNEATCRAQAVFVHLAIGILMYNLALSIYYYLVIVRNAPAQRIVTIEKFMHPICLVFAFGTAFASLGLGIFGPANFWCWIELGPNGENDIYRWLFYYGPLWVSVVITTILMAVIFRKLRRQDERQASWVPRSTRRSFVVQRMSSVSSSDGRTASERFKWQSLWYCGTFYTSMLPFTIVRGIQTAKKPVPMWFALWAITAACLWGFFNYIVYLRPRYKQYREQHPGVSFLRSVCKIYLHMELCKCGVAPLRSKQSERANDDEEQIGETESTARRKNQDDRDSPSLTWHIEDIERGASPRNQVVETREGKVSFDENPSDVKSGEETP